MPLEDGTPLPTIFTSPLSMEPVKLKNPSVTAEGYVINGRAFVDYILHAEDMEKA